MWEQQKYPCGDSRLGCPVREASFTSYTEFPLDGPAKYE
jgi:hypothetical protein